MQGLIVDIGMELWNNWDAKLKDFPEFLNDTMLYMIPSKIVWFLRKYYYKIVMQRHY